MELLIRDKLLAAAENTEDNLILSRIFDAYKLSEKYNSPMFSPFLSPRIGMVAQAVLTNLKVEFGQFGGYENAERKMIGFFGGDEDNALYPIVPIKVTLKNINEVSHRDVLGTLMSLGIKRDRVGDIILTDKIIIMAHCDISEFITQNLDRIKNFNVDSVIYKGEIVAPEKRYIELNKTVTSPRADSLVAQLAGISRYDASLIIEKGMAQINGFTVKKNFKLLCDGDILTVRGYGKAQVVFSGQSKKGRLHITMKKYV